MKKLFLVTPLIVAFCLALNAIPVFAAECGGVETAIIECDSSGAGAIRDVLKDAIQIAVIGVGILAVIGVMIVGIQYLTARDNKQQIAKAKQRLVSIVIGIVVYVLLVAITNWLLPGGLSANDQIAVESIEVSASQQVIEEGFSRNIGIYTYPLDAENSALTFVSSNPEVAKVDNTGRVTGVKAGTATITATTPDGRSAEVSLTVKEPAPTPERTAPSAAKKGGSSSGSSGTNSTAKGKCNYNSPDAEGCILFCQTKPEPWADKAYGNCSGGTYAKAGCAPASLAMIIANLTDDSSVTPLVIGNKAVSMGARVCGSGTNANKLIPVVKEYGLQYEKISFNKDAINKALDEGKLVWLSCDGRLPCATTGNGHFIVIRGKTSSGDWTFFNSAYGCNNNYSSSKKTYSPDATISAAYNSQNSGPYAIWK